MNDQDLYLKKKFILPAALLFYYIASGAFGAHYLEGKLDIKAFSWLETANQYLVIHAISIIICLIIDALFSTNTRAVRLFFYLGILLFSLSLTLMSLGQLFKTNLNWLGMITPLGGLSMLFGWLLFIIKMTRIN